MPKASSSKRAQALKTQPGTAKTATPPPPLSWPAFKPPLPVSDLLVESIVPAKVVVIRHFWPKSLCRDYVAFLRTLPLVPTPGRPRRGEAVRVNDRLQVDDPLFAARLWQQTGLRDALDRAQLSYDDDSNTVTLTADSPEPVQAKTTWTLLLYLTSSAEGCEGGETVFYSHDREVADEAVSVAPETGMLLLHKHGEDCLLHEGREVVSGEKWVLRTDLCVRK